MAAGARHAGWHSRVGAVAGCPVGLGWMPADEAASPPSAAPPQRARHHQLPAMQVTIKALTGGSYALDVSPSDTVSPAPPRPAPHAWRSTPAPSSQTDSHSGPLTPVPDPERQGEDCCNQGARGRAAEDHFCRQDPCQRPDPRQMQHQRKGLPRQHGQQAQTQAQGYRQHLGGSCNYTRTQGRAQGFPNGAAGCVSACGPQVRGAARAAHPGFKACAGRG